jgi:hypothetical protein
MRASMRVAIAVAAGALAACSRLPLRTVTAPGLQGVPWQAASYRLLAGPTARYGAVVADAHDPMLAGSTANRVVRTRIADALAARGYRADERAADVTIAFYASIRPDVDVTRWSYGYDFTPDWPRWPLPPLPSSRDGRLIIDVLDASGRNLLWRGEATMRLGRDIDENLSRLADLAGDVVQRMPAPRRHRVLAVSP